MVTVVPLYSPFKAFSRKPPGMIGAPVPQEDADKIINYLATPTARGSESLRN
jgi:hypothetical protein